MVLQRRLDYGFCGYEVPVVPRAARSARGKVPIWKKLENNPVCAIEILASVAGELLQETEGSAPNVACSHREDQNNSVEWEKEDRGKLLKTEHPDQETFEENSFAYVPGLRDHHQIYTVNELPHARKSFRNASGSCFATVAGGFPHLGKFFGGQIIGATESESKTDFFINQSRRSEKIHFVTKWPYFNSRNALRGPFGKVCGSSPQSGELVKGCLDTKELCRKSSALVNSESNFRVSLLRGCKTGGPSSKYCADVEVTSKDDEETSVWCSQPGTMVATSRASPNGVRRKIRNLSGSRHWRAAPNMKDWKRKPVYYNGRPCYTRQRSHGFSPFKRRKLFNRIPLSTSDGGLHCKDLFNSLGKGSNGDNSCAVKEASSAAQLAAPEPKSRDCNVKLSIKSLKVPELFIEIPATATVGSLKRTVMEAVTAVLGDALHVGVLLQGKAVRDDSKTLLQTGICHGDKRHRLGFVLEAKHAQFTPPPHTEDCPGTSQSLTGHMVTLSVQPVPSDITPLPQLMSAGGSVDHYSNAVRSIDDIFINNTMQDSQALVSVPAVTMEAVAIVPFHKKSKHHELVQRRTRRPFSVSEVEALVQAVEKLGTGRWRDVKLLAFDSAKHRTYVDLKDKWKTLVHTARISLQQRRGEPVPQQLLDRVLAAQAFWSQQQS